MVKAKLPYFNMREAKSIGITGQVQVFYAWTCPSFSPIVAARMLVSRRLPGKLMIRGLLTRAACGFRWRSRGAVPHSDSPSGALWLESCVGRGLPAAQKKHVSGSPAARRRAAPPGGEGYPGGRPRPSCPRRGSRAPTPSTRARGPRRRSRRTASCRRRAARRSAP